MSARESIQVSVEADVKMMAEVLAHTFREATHKHSYPEIPPPAVKASENGDGLPQISGIYFVWREDVVVYVGQSANIQQRARCGGYTKRGHEAVWQGDYISWIPESRKRLNFTEAFYIGIARPHRNFGGWRDAEKPVIA